MRVSVLGQVDDGRRPAVTVEREKRIRVQEVVGMITSLIAWLHSFYP